VGVARRSIADFSRQEFEALRERLEFARETLHCGGAFLQAVARAYYVVFALASFLAGKYGVRATHVRGRNQVTDQDFSHSELPSLVYALYCGNKKENVKDPGSSPGIGSGNYNERAAYRSADMLMETRLEADYGPSSVPEPYGKEQADRWLTIAKNLTMDLETLL
jgi:hypothetical protein